MPDTIVTCLWFDGEAERAARFYADTVPDSRVDAVRRAPADYPAGKAGDVLTVEFTLAGRAFLGLNGGAGKPFTQAISFQLMCDDQAEVDRYWAALTADGGAPVACGWCTDRWGLSWQVIPRRLTAALAHPDPATAKRAMEAMMTMVKIDIATIEAAVAGSEAG